MDQKIVQWIHYDNKIKEYNDKSKSIRAVKDKLSSEIIQELDIANKDKSQLPIFNIQALNTSITPQINNSYEGLTNKFLTACYREYFNSEEEAKKLLLFIKNKRKVEKKISLRRETLMDMNMTMND
jgi:hypothetical protein